MASSSPLNSSTITGEMEIRNLPSHILRRIETILDHNNSWIDLASNIPNPDFPDSGLLCANDIRVLEEQQRTRNISPTQSLLRYWGVYGRNRPNVQLLLELLNTSHLFRAAHYVAVDLLGKDQPVPEPDIPAVPLVNQPALLNDNEVPRYSYNMIYQATNGFCHKSLDDGGCLLGEGAFGVVYLAQLDSDNLVAVKILKNAVDKQFLTELQVLTRFAHPNLLPLLGCSIDGPSTCLVYEYLPTGSLQQCLSNKADPLHWFNRLTISIGTAKGINHLHTHESKPVVHRDIKSANILLDSDFNPKLGDFGLARLGSTGTSTTKVVTSTISGTTPYMSSEAFRGDISSKMDVFSYGVVLLELLTGLPPYDANREDMDLLSHVQENCDDICTLLDTGAGLWYTEVAESLYKVSVRCTKESKRERPSMAEVITILEELYSSTAAM